MGFPRVPVPHLRLVGVGNPGLAAESAGLDGVADQRRFSRPLVSDRRQLRLSLLCIPVSHHCPAVAGSSSPSGKRRTEPSIALSRASPIRPDDKLARTPTRRYAV